MIEIKGLSLPVRHSGEDLVKKIEKTLRLGRDNFSFEIAHRSLDARKKPDKRYIYQLHVRTKGEGRLVKSLRNPNVALLDKKPYVFPEGRPAAFAHPPLIIGTGPAGLFAGWYLARAGFRPLLIERGDRVELRSEKVERFWSGGELDPESNVQFGEGGAGTFSDGKLNTLVKDSQGRNGQVLSRFVSAGAPKEILYEQKPHLGTDVLKSVVASLREQIEEMGGQFRFSTRADDLLVENGALKGVLTGSGECIPCEVCVLAIGHSARDTFSMLHKKGLSMEARSFAVGLRVEHPQEEIDRAQYGDPKEAAFLGAASYKLTHKLADGRGVYSFCMCPGGYVVNASSEEGALAVNGMSYSLRDSKNANSAVIVSVSPDDYEGEGPLSGVEFQRRLEKKAYESCGGAIPVQRYEDFKEKRPSRGEGSLIPCIKGRYSYGDVRSILPENLAADIEEGMEAFGKKIRGFNDPDTLMVGLESRTTSPVRLIRDPISLCGSIDGIYPCGEGAGYAGGITSAAMDGIRVAEAIAKRSAL